MRKRAEAVEKGRGRRSGGGPKQGRKMICWGQLPQRRNHKKKLNHQPKLTSHHQIQVKKGFWARSDGCSSREGQGPQELLAG